MLSCAGVANAMMDDAERTSFFRIPRVIKFVRQKPGAVALFHGKNDHNRALTRCIINV